MNHKFITKQEKFWKGLFGSDYFTRHEVNEWVTNNKVFFNNCFKKIKKNSIKSMIEYGSSVGLNLIALNKILKLNDIRAIEINKIAYDNLTKLKYVEPINKSVLDYQSDKKYNFVLSKGFLIHVNPNLLKNVYKNMFNSCKSKGFILIAEYYSPNPETIKYRGNKNVLFRRDFAGEILKMYDKKIKLIDYGFTYHKDKYPQGDLTWFLLQKH